jgi:hypothetical protein
VQQNQKEVFVIQVYNKIEREIVKRQYLTYLRSLQAAARSSSSLSMGFRVHMVSTACSC